MHKKYTLVLAICILCAVIGSCNQKTDDDLISDKAEWYDSVRFEFIDQETNAGYVYSCCDDKSILLNVSNYNSFGSGCVLLGRDGSISDPIYVEGYNVVASYIYDDYHCIVTDDEGHFYDCLLNFDEGVATDMEAVDYVVPSGRSVQIRQVSRIGDHIVTLFNYYDYNGGEDSYMVKVDNNIYELDTVPGTYNTGAHFFLDCGNDVIFINCGDNEIENPEDEYRRKFVKMNIANGDMEDIIVREGDLLRKYYSDDWVQHSDRLLRTDSNEHLVYEYDIETNTESVIFDLQRFSVNADTMLFGTIVSADPEHPVITYHSGNSAGLNLLLYAMNKCDSDPTENKTLLTIKVADGTLNGYGVCSEAIYEFNRTNPDYYIIMAGDENRLFGGADSVTELISDIRNGTAPDILIDYGRYAVINNSDYLMDMSGFVNSEDLFVKSINPKSEDESRIIPLCVSAKTVITDPSYLTDSGNGLTVDEYIDFVSRLPNSVDPMVGCGQYRMWYFQDFLAPCFGCLFDANGEFDADNETFRRIAEYSSRLPEQVPDSYSANIGLPAHVVWCDIASNTNIVEAYAESDSNLVMVGMPTPDGTGFAASSFNDVCVTVCCDHPEGAGQFIDLLLSPDMQDYYSWSAAPNNKTSFEHVCSDNRIPSRLHEQLSNALCNISFVVVEDPELMTIIEEEIQPYFDGQKTLDQVITIINSRARTLLNERGM